MGRRKEGQRREENIKERVRNKRGRERFKVIMYLDVSKITQSLWSVER